MLDFRLTGRIEIRWHRYYDSTKAHRSFSIGRGSAHEYDRSLIQNGDELVYVEPLGRELRFPALARDGETCHLHGLTLLRLAARRYRLASRAIAIPAMEFTFVDTKQQSRVGRLLSGVAEVRFHYDTSGALVGMTDSLGRRIAAVEDSHGRLLQLLVEASATTAGYQLIAYEYDTQGNLTGTRNADGHGYSFIYDQKNRMVRRRGRKGFQFYYRYDSQGRCTRSMGDERLYGVALEYTVPGRVTHVTRPDLGRWVYNFSGRGDLETVRDPLGGIQKFVRGPDGRLAMIIDPNGNASRIVYDVAGAPIARIDPFGHRTPLPVPPGSAAIRPRLARSAAEYEHGWLLAFEPSVPPTLAEVAALGLPADTRPVLTVSSARLPGEAEGVHVRPLGAQWWPRPEAGRVFSPLGKLVSQADDFGRTRSWTYDASGNLSTYCDFDGGVWSYQYGAWHLLRGLTDPLGAEKRLSFTTGAQVASAIDSGGTRSDYRYDLCDRLVEVSRHEVVRDRYSRDAAGNLIAKSAGDGRTLLQIEIGPGNLPVRRKLACGEEHNLRYDHSGRLVEALTTKGRVEIAYDALGNRVSEKRDGIGIVHDFHGRQKRPTESVYFDHFRVRYRWQRHRVAITDPTGAEHEIVLHGSGIVERNFASGTREIAQYDRVGRCLGKAVRHRAGAIWTRCYHWSGESELRAIEDNQFGSVRCDYDAAHRLRRRVVGGQVETYDLDAADNLLAQPGLSGVSLQDGNRLAAANGWRFTYNDRHHQAVRDGPDGPIRYRYNSRDQLVAVEKPAGLLECEYDALGRRTIKRWNGQTTTFFWYDNQLIAEQGKDGSLRLYIYTDGLALTPLLIVDYGDSTAPAESGSCYAVFADQIGIPCLIEDMEGNIGWRARICPYGHAELIGAPHIDLRLRFPGHYADSEVDLHYNRFRHYDPLLGRYLQSDPWGVAGGWNLYAYRTNPLHDVDVRGLGDEHDPGSPCHNEDEETPPSGIHYNDDGEAERPRLGLKEGQEIVDTIHDALSPIAAKKSTTTLTETQDGAIIITNSDKTTKDQRQVIADMKEPGGPLEGRRVLVPDDQHDPGGGYIPKEDRRLPPQGENGKPTGSEGHGEQRGMQAANHYDQHGDQNGQGHGPADTQWSRSDAPHQGLACPGCAAAQHNNNVYNPTGVDPNPKGH